MKIRTRTRVLPENVRIALHHSRLRKALHRHHRPCPTCGTITSVCGQCIRTFCLLCTMSQCPHCHHRLSNLPIRALEQPIAPDTEPQPIAPPLRNRVRTKKLPVQVVANNELPVMWRNYAAKLSAVGIVITACHPYPYGKDTTQFEIWYPPGSYSEGPHPTELIGVSVANWNVTPLKGGKTVYFTVKDNDNI